VILFLQLRLRSSYWTQYLSRNSGIVLLAAAMGQPILARHSETTKDNSKMEPSAKVIFVDKGTALC